MGRRVRSFTIMALTVHALACSAVALSQDTGTDDGSSESNEVASESDYTVAEVAVFFSALTSIVTGLITLFFERRRSEHLTADFEKRLTEARKELDDFKRSVEYYTNVDHAVVLDGPKAAGKSSLMAKWINPDSKIETMIHTIGVAINSTPLFVHSKQYSKDGYKYEDRYRIVFRDVSGDQEHVVAKTIRALPATYKPVVVLVVDPLNLDESFARLSPQHMKLVYLDEDVSAQVCGFVVYVSKLDKLPESEREVVKAKVKARIAESIAPFLPPRSGKEMPVVFGSAASGEGMFDLQSAILRRFGIHLPRHQSERQT